MRRIWSTVKRWWGQLTSMRTALVLLFLLAVAAVPGSILPQRSVNQENVAQYFTENPKAAPILDRLWMFDVYSAPWFAAIYGLLFVSLIGCLVPRLKDHVDALRRKPPDAPARLDLMPEKAQWTVEESVGDTPARLRRILRAQRFRTVVRDHDDGTVTVSGEKGYLRETGNLLFHFSLVGLLIGVAVGALYGWHGNRILSQGADAGFCNNLQQYDDYGLGPNLTAADLPPFCLQLEDFHASYLDNGQPTRYAADLLYSNGNQVPSDPYTLEVNEPLRLDHASVYLLGNGYTPVITYTDRHGVTQRSATPFLPLDSTNTSQGVAMFPDANLDPATGLRDPSLQVAFEGLFMPTVPDQAPFTTSLFPDARNPAVMLFAYRGDLGLDDGVPASVYQLDKTQVDNGELEPIGEGRLLHLGESFTLDDGTTVKFAGLERYATVQVRSDPGETLVLASAVCVLVGLLPSLFLRRRRVWFRVSGDTVTAGGLPRGENPGFAAEFGSIIEKAKAKGAPS